MTTSMILFLTGLGCGVFFAAVAAWAQANRGSVRDVHWRLPIGIVAFGAAFGGLAFLIDSGVAGKTLFEAEVPGSGTAVPSVLEWKIPVEHPGAGHERTWDGYDVEFTPPVDGELRLTVTLLTPHVPTVHVRMGDEEKTDGQRIPSY